MIEADADIVILGAGFAGSLAALLLERIGRTAVLIDRGAHPRFVIGESSTPLANFMLARLADRYGLPRLAPLASYGSWKRVYPEIPCGLKRGFSYFQHRRGERFAPRSDRSNELLVAASRADEDADTHWVRADFDHFLVREAQTAGIIYVDRTEVSGIERDADGGWALSGTRMGEPFQARGRWLFDGSGEGGFLPRRLGIGPHPAGLRTQSRALYAHFRGVARFQPIYESLGGDASAHPYPCDQAALHHCFEGGWMWVLPFDHGVTSAGFALDPRVHPLPPFPPDEEWRRLMHDFPTIGEQFREAFIVTDEGRFRRTTGVIQRRLERSFGDGFVLLPGTVAFLDPLHSTGNAQTLFGVARLIEIVERHWGRDSMLPALEAYDRALQAETEFLDAVVAGSFRGFARFPRMVAMSMFYFATAIYHEQQWLRGCAATGGAFLAADDPALREGVEQAWRLLNDEAISDDALMDAVCRLIAPFNLVGLGDPARRNMYAYPS